MGTLGYGLPDALETEVALTTPDAVSVQRQLYVLKTRSVQYVCLEASSIGLEQGRLKEVRVHAALYTNLSRDHLDYHSSMESYAQAKERLAKFKGLKAAIVNADDAHAVRFGQLAFECGRGL
ncbi:MAG: hypothetical protein HC848_08930 [Limnobacter sp.]|nr:hypothetical protein [Limnobacter sp.]